MQYHYKTKNVCSSEISFDLEGNKLHNVVFTGGCNGNLKAIGKLVEGMDADQVIALLQGNTCGRNFTSCADQLTKAILEAKEN
ncbi:MAG: TIGR03905 family TSCPD domain-containing protein, partial [Clostridia bacterium]|nr:TIGR03905 family TSCPD domain-containing protein [Clostridia bacterium]